jgi:ketosteroid isomerase-like protein
VFEQFTRESAMGFEGTLVADDRRFVESSDMGYMVCMERTSGMTQAGGEIRIDIRATTIFRKEAGHWRVVHHHTDTF